MSKILEFCVIGEPAPQGSKRAYKNIIVESSAKVKPWRAAVAAAASEAAQNCGWQLSDGPMIVEIVFRLKRPRAHYGKHGLRLFAPNYPDRKPDIDKLLRSTLDGLIDSNSIMTDDARIIRLIGEKAYANQSVPLGAIIRVSSA